MRKKWTTEEFVKRAVEIHGDTSYLTNLIESLIQEYKDTQNNQAAQAA